MSHDCLYYSAKRNEHLISFSLYFHRFINTDCLNDFFFLSQKAIMKNLTQYKGKCKLVMNDKSNYMHEMALYAFNNEECKILAYFCG